MFPVNYMAMGIISQTRQKNHGYGLKSVKEVVENTMEQLKSKLTVIYLQ